MLGFKQYIIEELSLQYHKTLNPLLWTKTGSLRPEVLKKLLQFADAWSTFAGIPKSAIVDIIFSGGNTNYNYTKASDIDVHIVVDKSKLPYAKDFADDYLWDKKMLWTLTHDIKIKSYSLEPFAQDKEEKHPKNQGVYSLKSKSWIQKPTNLNLDFNNNSYVKKKSQHYKKVIDHMIAHKMSSNTYDKFKKKLSNMRSSGITKSGEFSDENLVFKELRNAGYIDKMNKYIQTKQDKKLSLR
jgi:hypothetical protein